MSCCAPFAGFWGVALRRHGRSRSGQFPTSYLAHVTSSEGRLANGRVFNRFSENLPMLFEPMEDFVSLFLMPSLYLLVNREPVTVG